MIYRLLYVVCILKKGCGIFFSPLFWPWICRKGKCFFNTEYISVIEKYFDHIHTVQDQPVTIHKKLNKLLVENLNEVLAMYNRGVRLTFTDIRAIKTIMEKELNEIWYWMRLSKIKRNAIDYGGKIMSNFFDETMQGLLEAAEIAKGNITLTEWENMPAPTFYVADNV